MPSSFAIGPFTTSNGAWGLVDISNDVPPCEPIWDNALTDAIITGMCSGLAPAIAALMAIFSTVARPKPGGMSQINSSASKLEPAINSSTASAVGGWSTKESPQSRISHCSFILRMASQRSSPSKRCISATSSRSRRPCC